MFVHSKRIIYFLLLKVLYIDSNQLFHERTKITFVPDEEANYFGYNVLLSDNGLLVGAPKAKSRVTSVSPGLVFNCTLNNLPDHEQDVICNPFILDDVRAPRHIRNFFRNDMWFGASMSFISNDYLLICAPRFTSSLGENHLLANGACYIKTRRDIIYPLKDINRQAFRITDDLRRDYGDYKAHLNFFAYGQAGFSMKVTENNSVIMGAPGLLQWTGGIVDYKYEKRPTNVILMKNEVLNPYYTVELASDEYLGYSIESGIFEEKGEVLYIAGAPRGHFGNGRVIIFKPVRRERDPLNIVARIEGPLLGSYFGATLCATDIDGDGLSDILIGAPNFVQNDGGLPYDQGAVFVYMTRSSEVPPGFLLDNRGYVSGSGESGARFGSTIADLGDIDNDGFKDIAIGAPWENDGSGVVYIYKGYRNGLKSTYAQRISVADAKGFGMSISKGLDVDSNNCSDLAVGAHNSESAYIYRCIPTIDIFTSIKVPEAMDLHENITNFTAIFCVTLPPKEKWSHVQIDLNATITVDKVENRATILGDPQFVISSIQPGNNRCEEQVIEIKPTAHFSRPISIEFDVTATSPDTFNVFTDNLARTSEISSLRSVFDIQLTRGCGEDLICMPWLEFDVQPLTDPYIPGTDDKLGARIFIKNNGEPAYGAKVDIVLPLLPKRVPEACSLQEFNMTCDVPSPLFSNKSVLWEIELENSLRLSENRRLTIVTELKDSLYRRITNESYKELYLDITPKSEFTISGESLPNVTMIIKREKFKERGNITFTHYYEIRNHGPSDWPRLLVRIDLPKSVNLSNPIKDCESFVSDYIECSWSMPANVSMPVILPLRFDLNSTYGAEVADNNVNISTRVSLILNDGYKSINVTTRFTLEPASPLWLIIIAGVVAGVILLTLLIFFLYKCRFFSRKSHEELKKLKMSPETNDEPSRSSTDLDSTPVDFSLNESCMELIDNDSE